MNMSKRLYRRLQRGPSAELDLPVSALLGGEHALLHVLQIKTNILQLEYKSFTVLRFCQLCLLTAE